jgi:3-dehydroquinate synthase
MKNFTIAVKPQRERYRVIVGSGAIADLPGLVESLHDVDRVIVLYDKGVEGIASKISSDLGGSEAIAVPRGEESKSLQQVERIVQDLLLKRATRNSILICVGGGMITDLGGFIAGVYMRGIRHIQVPTTMMAMADAAIGGKNSVNLGSIKSIIGAYTHPEGVVVDVNILAGLPDEHLRCGLVEVVKMATVWDKEFFGWLEENLSRVINREDEAVRVCIENAVRMKSEVVAKGDENIRMFFHFGHTVGLAVEALSLFSLPHGKAVSIGMVTEMEIAQVNERERVVKLLEILDVPTTIPVRTNPEKIWEVMLNDKKVKGDDVRIAVPKKLGQAELRTVTKKEFLEACQ